ncbi:hypothetical protein BGZ70_003099 [Mortierella alpina]|uniref:Transmembrane protein 198 n=1 Tax=Mortierella alpina TaxID=64518 RepID=A0A9P6ITE6_MORAP|nr:hypothetical protein BGZ70_003099 [Mortierella alpina]
MAPLRAIGILLLLLSIICSTVYSSKTSVDADSLVERSKDSINSNANNNNNNKHTSAFDKGYALVNDPLDPSLAQQEGARGVPFLVPSTSKSPVEQMPEEGGDGYTIRTQSSFQDFFSENYNRIQAPLNWQRVIAGGVLLAVGLLLCFFGFLHLRFSLLLTGFIGGAIAAYAILTNTEPDGLWANRILIYVAVCVAAGLLVGLVLLGMNKFASWVLGGAGGLALGVYILSWRDGGLIHNPVGRIALMAGAAALGMFLSMFLGSLTIIFATVLIGGYMFTLGLDMFLRTGFLENYKQLFKSSSTVNYQLYSGIYGMLGVLSLMFLLGYLVQIPLYFLHRRKQRRQAVPPVNGPYAGGYNNRNSQYSQWDSQYGSRDHLAGGGGPYNPAPAPEYTWWGKRKNKDAHLTNNPYGYGYSEKGYHNVHSESRSVNNLNQAQHLNTGKAVDRNYYQGPAGGVGGPKAEVDNSMNRVSMASAPMGGTTYASPTIKRSSVLSAPVAIASTTGDRTVVFEEKKNWLGRTKVVPRLTDTASVGHTMPASVNHGAMPAGATTSTTAMGTAEEVVPSTSTGVPAHY